MRAGQVTGVRETLRDLRQIDPELKRTTNRRIRGAAEPLTQAIRRLIPSAAPMSGWTRGRYGFDGGAASAGVRARIGGRVSHTSSGLGGFAGGSSSWPLLSMEQRDAGGAVFDIAGRSSSGRTPQGRQFIQNLNRHGGASRSMWPGVEENIDIVQDEVKRAVDDMSDAINRRLRN
jgi:hypothetical protein